MKLFLFLLFSLSHLLTCFSQTTDFPASWQGKWSGNLEIFTAQGLAQTVPMELHIAPVDSVTWTWIIIYGEDKEAGKRDYLLRVKDAAKGIYSIDEQNSIVLDAYLLGGKLYERFEVMGNLLTTATEKVGENLVFEIIAGSMEPASVTGGEKIGEEEIPEVKGYPINVRQKAVLEKIE